MNENDFIDNSALKTALYLNVIDFNKKIIGTPQLKECALLSKDRLKFAQKVLNEEIKEFNDAHEKKDLPGALDAMIDSIYYAFGRIYEMGVTPLQFTDCWENVHEANMKKVKGNKGRGSIEDAIKPADWIEPKMVIDQINSEYTKTRTGLAQLSCPKCVSVYGPIIEKTYEEICKNLNKAEPKATFSNLSLSEIPEVFIECTLLRKKKKTDYQNSSISLKDYFPFKRLSYYQMLHTKMLRLKSLIEDNKQPKNESIRDTLLDLINYSSFAIEAIDENMF